MTNPFYENIMVRHDMQTLAFYNVENLFDLKSNKYTNDREFISSSVKNWTPKRYENKLRKLGFCMANIGRRETGKHPALIGLAEVENKTVLNDLLESKHLNKFNYNYVHYDSMDERGIDVALLYDEDVFQVTHSEIFTISLLDKDGDPDYTRDILLVSGVLENTPIHVIVNHWSSRREGAQETEVKRMASSYKVQEIISRLKLEHEQLNIIVMGDFNDDPHNTSIKQMVDHSALYNPFETLRSFNRGTVKHKRQWFLFDQIMLSSNFLKHSIDQFEFFKANIFDEDFLKLFKGPFKGAPFRTYVGQKYKGGYSDHFPVYLILKK